MEFLLENEYGKHYIDQSGKVVVIPNEDAKEYCKAKQLVAIAQGESVYLD